MIKFKATNEFERGIIYKLLCESYGGLLKARPDYTEEYKTDWRKADDNTFDCPDSIGQCVLISVLQNEPIGFFSWDPRRIPDEGEVGQNCIVPSHRGKGYGKLQIQEILKIFRLRATQVVKAKTHNDPFFIPAQKTYLSCGFKEVGHSRIDKYGGLELIHYGYRGR